jgi:Outer membrane protein beta-barrel domain
MKQLLILVATLASLTILGQDTNPTQKILIGFNFSPDYSSRTLKNNDGSSSSDLVIKSRNDIEVAKFGFTTGLNVCFNFSQLVGFETGIQFSNKGYKTKNQDLIYFPPSPSSPTKSKTTYAYQYIGIPLKAKFSFGKSKVRFISSIGFMTNLLLNVKQTNNFEYSNGKTEKKTQSTTSGFKKVDISPIISVGIDYKLNNKIHLLAEPTFRYGAVKTKDAPVTENLWNTGLNVGLYYALK